jgi:hypothetical protein
MKKTVALLLVLGVLALVPAMPPPASAEPVAQVLPRVEFTAFENVRRDSNIVYSSLQVKVEEGDSKLRVSFADEAWWLSEPDSTVVYATLERCDGLECYPMGRVEMPGYKDKPIPPKPPGNMTTSIDGIVGQQVRVTFYFVSDDQTEKFQVSAHIE